jgi:hypothetical protein
VAVVAEYRKRMRWGRVVASSGRKRTPMTAPISVLSSRMRLIRIDLAGKLEDEGFVVFEASNADQAIAVLQEQPSIRLNDHRHQYARQHRWFKARGRR